MTKDDTYHIQSSRWQETCEKWGLDEDVTELLQNEIKFLGEAMAGLFMPAFKWSVPLHNATADTQRC